MNRITALLGILMLVITLAACGASSAPPPLTAPAAQHTTEGAMSDVQDSAGLPGAPGQPQTMMAPAAPAVQPAATAAAAQVLSAPLSAPPPAPPSAPIVETAMMLSEDESRSQFFQNTPLTQEQAALVAQNRIIVRTVDMRLVVPDVATAVDEVRDIAANFGGWVVSSDRSSRHGGFINIRVPSQLLDEAVHTLRSIAADVRSEISNSKDVTDEYVDINSRLESLTATEAALIKLLDKADEVEDALDVQRELVRLQSEIESIKGRIKFLEETSAFSLINVSLELEPVAMPLDAGQDKTFSIGQIARFRATFQPPEGIDNFTFTWDFGDGSPPITGHSSAPTTQTGTRVTATVNHAFHDDRDSPYIVHLTITGTGDAGLAEGSDSFIATVTKIPVIQVFVNEVPTVVEDEEIEYIASFTYPDGLSDLQFRWDFGDGTPVVTGVPAEGETRASVIHTYADYRDFPYHATFSVSAQSEVGPIESTSVFDVFVIESKGLVISGWSASETGKSAVRTLSGVAQAVGTLLIWLGIFSPVWLIGGGIIYLIVRTERRMRVNRRRSNRNRYTPVESASDDAEA